MTLVDERSRVPALDDDRLERLARALDRDGVVAAMLIGSQARGTAGPLSDIDVAFWHEPELSSKQLLELRLALLRAAARALGTEEVDAIPLNAASPLMRHRAIRDAHLLVERDGRQRVRLEARAILDYLDTQPLRDELARGLRKRLAEDRFGRP